MPEVSMRELPKVRTKGRRLGTLRVLKKGTKKLKPKKVLDNPRGSLS